MTEEDLQYFKNLLEAKHASMVQDLGTLESQSMKTTSAASSGDLTYSDHMADLGNAAMEREKAFLFASRDGAYLDQVEAALTRIKIRAFGMCRSCGCEIPRARLEAVPTTQVCVPCKESENGHTVKSA